MGAAHLHTDTHRTAITHTTYPQCVKIFYPSILIQSNIQCSVEVKLYRAFVYVLKHLQKLFSKKIMYYLN